MFVHLYNFHVWCNFSFNLCYLYFVKMLKIAEQEYNRRRRY